MDRGGAIVVAEEQQGSVVQFEQAIHGAATLTRIGAREDLHQDTAAAARTACFLVLFVGLVVTAAVSKQRFAGCAHGNVFLAKAR